MTRVFLLLVALVPIMSHSVGTRIGTGCRITSTNPTAVSTSSDSDCKWQTGARLELQCDVAAHVARSGETATTSHAKIAVGDPYPLKASYDNEPFSVLASAGTAVCEFYRVP